MARKEELKENFKDTLREGTYIGDSYPKEKVIEGVEKKQPLILYSFPNINGVRISVMARSMEEAIKKAKEEVSKLK